MKLTPVDGNPFDEDRKKGYKLVPVSDPFQPVQPDDPGAMQAAWLGFGRMADKLVEGGKQAAHTVGSLIPGVGESSKEKLALMERLQAMRDEGYAPLQQQHPIATSLGESAPLLAMPLGGSLRAAAAIGALPGLVEYGTTKEKLTKGAAGAAGSGVGYGVGKAIGAIASPGMRASPEAERLAQVASREGIPLDAAQVTGNPVLQNMKAGLSKLPWTSTGQQAVAQRQQEAYNAALLRGMGGRGATATPDVLGDVYAAAGGKIQEASEGVTLKIDDAFVNGLADVERKFLRRLPTDQKPVIKSYLDDMTELIGKGELPGDVYQSTRSELGRLAAETDNVTVKQSAKGMQRVLDDLFDRQAGADASKKMAEGRQDYSRYSTVKDAIKRGRNQDGNASPKQVYAQAQRDIPGFERGAGGDWADLIRSGRQFLPDTIPNSGTPERLAYMNLLTAGSMGGLGALGGQLSTGDPSTGAMLGLLGFGTSKGAQALLNSPALTKYLMKQTLTAEEKRLLARAMGSAGLLGASAASN